MRRFRLVAAATVVTASLIAPSAILAEEPTADSAESAGGITAPAPTAPASAAQPFAPAAANSADATDENSADTMAAADERASGRASGEGAEAGVKAAIGSALVVSPARETRLRAATRRSASASATPAASVAIRDYFYSPKKVTIDAGETVKWRNDGNVSEGHTVTSDSFDSSVLKHGQTYTHKFSKTGTYDYFCALHPSMTGKVVVKSAGAGSGGSDSSDGGVSDPASNTSGTYTDTTSSYGSLPYTGQDLRIALVVGVNLLLAGALLLLRSRRPAPR